MDSFQAQTLEILHELSERLASVESDLAELAGRRRRLPREFIDLDEAARLYGASKRAVQSLLRRERDRPRGFAVRRRHGAVHLADFRALLELKGKEGATGRGQAIREALKSIRED